MAHRLAWSRRFGWALGGFSGPGSSRRSAQPTRAAPRPPWPALSPGEPLGDTPSANGSSQLSVATSSPCPETRLPAGADTTAAPETAPNPARPCRTTARSARTGAGETSWLPASAIPPTTAAACDGWGWSAATSCSSSWCFLYFFLVRVAPLSRGRLVLGRLAFFPLASPWWLAYRRKANGRANTLVGAQRGQRSSKASTTPSWPQEKTWSALRENSGSWCLPAPNKPDRACGTACRRQPAGWDRPQRSVRSAGGGGRCSGCPTPRQSGQRNDGSRTSGRCRPDRR